MKTVAKWSLFFLFGIIIGIAAFWYQLTQALPDTFYVPQGHTLQFNALPFVSARPAQPDTQAAGVQTGNSYSAEIRLLGFIPVKSARVQVISKQTVLVSGQPFGMKMFSDGVMVVGFSDIYTGNGYRNPAKEAGLSLGDTIHTINGISVRSNEDIKKAVENSKGKSLVLSFSHNGEAFSSLLKPVLQENQQETAYRLGMWVRDSSAGIGTLTLSREFDGIFAGLGHSIADTDTGERIPLLHGEIVPVTITGCTKSVTGCPGELRGNFMPETAGHILNNRECGVFGQCGPSFSRYFQGTPMEILPMQEVKSGKAQILTTLSGTVPVAYDVEIEKLCYTADSPNKNILLRVTDRRLLDTAGGIVQGMSGSPIIQDGRLVGAVTHVIVNDPTKGYGIFIENMLNAAE